MGLVLKGLGLKGLGRKGPGLNGTGTQRTGIKGLGLNGTGTQRTGIKGLGHKGLGLNLTGTQGTKGLGLNGTGQRGLTLCLLHMLLQQSTKSSYNFFFTQLFWFVSCSLMAKFVNQLNVSAQQKIAPLLLHFLLFKCNRRFPKHCWQFPYRYCLLFGTGLTRGLFALDWIASL